MLYLYVLVIYLGFLRVFSTSQKILLYLAHKNKLHTFYGMNPSQQLSDIELWNLNALHKCTRIHRNTYTCIYSWFFKKKKNLTAYFPCLYHNKILLWILLLFFSPALTPINFSTLLKLPTLISQFVWLSFMHKAMSKVKTKYNFNPYLLINKWKDMVHYTVATACSKRKSNFVSVKQLLLTSEYWI